MKRKPLLTTFFLVLACCISAKHPGESQSPSYSIRTISSWDVFVEALVMTESGGNPSAVGKNNDAGILQITPIYVKEVNRIAQKNYTLEDRFDPDKSKEMFQIMNTHYNPSFNIDRAIRIHNPGAGNWYSTRIKGYMKSQIENYQPGMELNGEVILKADMLEDYSIVLTTKSI